MLEEVMGYVSEETWEEYAKRVTARLKKVRKGTKLKNIRSKIVAVATDNIDRKHPYVFVEYVQKLGKHKGSRRRTAWLVENVAIAK